MSGTGEDAGSVNIFCTGRAPVALIGQSGMDQCKCFFTMGMSTLQLAPQAGHVSFSGTKLSSLASIVMDDPATISCVIEPLTLKLYVLPKSRSDNISFR